MNRYHFACLILIITLAVKHPFSAEIFLISFPNGSNFIFVMAPSGRFTYHHCYRLGLRGSSILAIPGAEFTDGIIKKLLGWSSFIFYIFNKYMLIPGCQI